MDHISGPSGIICIKCGSILLQINPFQWIIKLSMPTDDDFNKGFSLYEIPGIQ